MSESLSIHASWEEPFDSEQVTHVKGDIAAHSAPPGEWLVNVSDQVVVPMTTVDVVGALRSCRVTDRSLVWRAGMQDWTPLGDVPQLCLAAGPGASAPSAVPVRSERVALPPSDRMLRPPPKEPARAARDERARRSTLPYVLPVARDTTTIPEPAALHAALAATAATSATGPATPSSEHDPAAAQAVAEDVDALAIYDRVTPSLTFSDSIRDEWRGETQLVSQSAPSTRPAIALRARPRPPIKPRLQPKARLTLEPQSDPMHSARVEPQLKYFGSQPPSSIAPTTSEPEIEIEIERVTRGAGLWGDLSVVLASDMRAVKKSSKRVTLIASIGSAMLASLFTLWFAHSSSRPPAAERAVAVQAAPVVAPPKVEPERAAAPPVAVSVPQRQATPTPTHTPTATAHSVAAASSTLVLHAAPKPTIIAPRAAARPKPAQPVETESPTTASPDTNPYVDPSDPSGPGQLKTPPASEKETGAPSTDEPTPKAPNVSSGLEDSASPAHPGPVAAPGS